MTLNASLPMAKPRAIAFKTNWLFFAKFVILNGVKDDKTFFSF